MIIWLHARPFGSAKLTLSVLQWTYLVCPTRFCVERCLPNADKQEAHAVIDTQSVRCGPTKKCLKFSNGG
jgi:hypothetical protein